MDAGTMVNGHIMAGYVMRECGISHAHQLKQAESWEKIIECKYCGKKTLAILILSFVKYYFKQQERYED
jgi:hypothetical protein